MIKLFYRLIKSTKDIFPYEERKNIIDVIRRAYKEGIISSEQIERTMRHGIIGKEELGLGHSALLSVLLFDVTHKKDFASEELNKLHTKTSLSIIAGLSKVYGLNSLLAQEISNANNKENMRSLLLSFAQDIRVILIIIAEHVDSMRNIDNETEESRNAILNTSSYLYTPITHRLGLYKIKTELEDLHLKYTNKEIYKEIAHKLNETKASRDAYINTFIAPIKAKTEQLGFNFEIKGRTKSIQSIWSKIKKQQVPFEKIFDLFAIRIIVDVPLEQEKSACWQIFSIVTDMYPHNPNRLRDWLSYPKANGYESLHVTVMAAEGRWVEVQIRTKRMDEIAEKGLAAHWKYKGGKESSIDTWLAGVRELLENSDSTNQAAIDDFKMNLYDEEVFVFTPKGDLIKLRKGSTVLDFAYSIHSNIGNSCIGANVNNKHVTIKHILQNGDQITILTSPNQKPKKDWLTWVFSSRAKSKIRQAIKEIDFKEAQIGKETLQRRLKNWKIEYNETEIAQLAKKLGHKTVSNFYQAINLEQIDLLKIRDLLQDKEQDAIEQRTAEGFTSHTDLDKITSGNDVLVIDHNLKDIDYTLAKCCNPIYGDDVFGFVTISGGIKIHRESCPNAGDLRSRFGYRIVKAQWSGQGVGSSYPIILTVIGHDDIGVVANITSLITKEEQVNMRSISVNAHAGLFEGKITVMVSNNSQLDNIIKKIKTIKGVKSVYR